MSAPELPDIFGNYALGEFVEVVSPAAISWWPQTVAWNVLGLLFAVLLLFRAYKALLSWYRNRYRREAQARLQQLAIRLPEGLPVSDINRLLKLTALVPFPRQQVASLSGADWVNFLNRQCPEAPFTEEQLTLLATGSYQAQQLDRNQGEALLGACETWVSEHRDSRHA
jgi:hypothetical protein